MSLKISNIEISNPLILAPMAGYTDSPFRQICRKHGAGMTYTELISSEGIVRNNARTTDYLKFHESERPIAIQLFGKDPAVMRDAAQFVEKYAPDVIDINMGCCAPKIAGSGSGAALLCDPDILREIASSVVRAVKIPVSAKIRIGWDFSSLNYKTTVKILADCGISHVAVHGRTNSQKYTGRADWNIISEIAEFSNVPVIGSGDIDSFDDAREKLKSSGCAAVMIGRKAIGNPWIFSGMTPTVAEIKSQIFEHVGIMTELHGDYGIILSRKHLVKYIHGFANSSASRQMLIHAESIDDVEKALNLF